MIATENEIGPQTRMKDLLAAYPGARRALFRRYHIGGCSSCGFNPEETLQQVCDRNNRIDSAEVLAHIRASHEQDARLLIEPKELAQLLKENPAVKVVDIRSRPEWNTTRLATAVLLSQDLMQEMMSRWPKETPVVIYDHAGNQGLDAAAYFSGHGMTNVRALRGGIDAWASEVDASVPRYQIQHSEK
jgi:rhodanese-related sulfurtransferase